MPPESEPADEQTEPGDAGADHAVPPGLLELHQVLEWKDAVEQQQ